MCDHCHCRDNAPIADLTAEHETILSLAWRLAEATRAGQPAGDAAREQLLALLDLHTTKEETGLYPLLQEHDGLSPETSDALESEHRALRAVLTGGVFDRRAYYALAAHIEEEEYELFPRAMFAFDELLWDELEVIHRNAARAPAGVTG